MLISVLLALYWTQRPYRGDFSALNAHFELARISREIASQTGGAVDQITTGDSTVNGALHALASY
jgi:hypothetical protein